MASKTLKEIEKVVDDYEKQLKKQGYVTLYNVSNIEVDLKLPKDKGLEKFFKEFFYYNHLERYDVSTTSFTHSIQSNSYAEKCIVNQRRSIGDLFRLARKYYSNNITLWDVMEAMYNLVQTNTVIRARKSNSYYGVIYCTICTTIHRRVFNIYLNQSSRSSYRLDSFSNEYKQTTYLTKEFNILGEDYNTIFNTIAGKDFLKRKRESNFTLQVSPQEELDRAVMEKLSKMQSRPMELKSEVVGKTIWKARRTGSSLLLNLDDDDIDF